jgi:signal transduction histidine kinase
MKEKAVTVKHMVFSPKRSITVVMMLIIWAGVMGSMFAAISYDLRSRDFLKGRVQTIAAALPATQITEVSTEPISPDNPSYRDLQDRLQLIHSNNPDTTDVYLLGRTDSSVVLNATASQSDSRPGQVYALATSSLKEGFSSDGPFVTGPTRTGRAAHMSAYAPITDPDTRKIIALVGIDISATSYYMPLIAYTLVPLLLAAIPLAGLLRDNKVAAKQWELVQLKNQFVSIASHELRSPLNGLLWAIQSLMKTANRADQEMLEDMYRSAEASLVTVNEILDFSIFDRNQAGKLQKDPVDLASVLRDVTSTLRLGAKEKGLTLKFQDGWPPEVLTTGDAGALKRAYMNIVSNAIKYSPQGSEITYRYQQKDGRHIVSVRDHGIGIPEDEQDKVLGGYYRATNAAKTQSHGTGLGLWVTRLIVEQHGGQLWLDSKVDQGTTIHASFPTKSA